MKSVGNRVGVSEPFLMRMAHGAPVRNFNRSADNSNRLRGKFENRSGVTNKSVVSDEQTLRVCKRFYVAVILSRLVQVFIVFLSFLFLNQMRSILT